MAAAFFDEKKLKDLLKQMDPCSMEKFVNDYIDKLGMPQSEKQGNANHDTAFTHLGTAITAGVQYGQGSAEAVYQARGKLIKG
jgi:hypothetical protein